MLITRAAAVVVPVALSLALAGCLGSGQAQQTVSLPPPSSSENTSAGPASATASGGAVSATTARGANPTTVTVSATVTGSPTGSSTLPSLPSPSVSRRVVSGERLLFQTPTRNIACIMHGTAIGDAVRCDIRTHSWTATAKPAVCEFDWGNGMAVTGHGADFTCASDTVLGATGGLVADYGTAYRVPGYECVVLNTDITCRNLTTGHGFTMSREMARAF